MKRRQIKGDSVLAWAILPEPLLPGEIRKVETPDGGRLWVQLATRRERLLWALGAPVRWLRRQFRRGDVA